MTGAPVRYSPQVEQIREDEAETIGNINQAFDSILETTAEDYHHAVRAVHAKAHGILEGVLTVGALPPELAQGLFARPGEHRVYLRLSTNAGDILPDDVVLPRGLAIKVLDVEGERLPGADGTTQDFVLVNSPVFQAKTAEEFAGSLKLLAKTTDKMEGAKQALSAVLGGINSALGAVGIPPSTTLAALGGAPNVDPLGETYFSVTPFRYGDYIAKFSLVPLSPELASLEGHEIVIAGNPDAIRDTVRQEMRRIDGVWEFRVQLCRDLEKQPVEDPTVEWKSEDSPWLRVATLHAGPQDSWDTARVQEVDEEMRFSVWTGLEAHQPLGNINRARRETYEHSAAFRAGFNRCPIHEPRSS